MAAAGTSTLPSRSYPQIRRARRPELPASIPGGAAGLAPLPAVILAPPAAAPSYTPPGPIAGGNHGPVTYFTPSIDKQAPYNPLAGNEGFSVRSTDGTPIWWRRFFFPNTAGVEHFIPAAFATPSWTANSQDLAPPTPGVTVPASAKHISTGGYFREAYVDEQLFSQLTDRGHPWPIQKPMPLRIRQAAAQAKQRAPYPYQLTRYQPAASYGQTTNTLLSAALANLLPASQAGGTNPTTGGSPYGSY